MTQVESDAQLGNIPETTPEMKRAATLTVCAAAESAADAHLMLAMLGLTGGSDA